MVKMSRSRGLITPSSQSASKLTTRGPEVPAVKQYRHRIDLAGLDQRQQFEQFVERPEPARKGGERAGMQQEVHLPEREIVELHAQVRRHIFVRRLLVRQHDIQRDRFGAGVRRAAVRRLHDRRPAARTHHELALAVLVPRQFADHLRQLARDLVIMRLGDQPLGDPLRLLALRHAQHGLRLFWRGNTCRAVEYERRPDVRFIQQQLRFQQFQLKPHRTQILAQQEIHVLEGEPVGRVLGLRGGNAGLGGFGFLLRAAENAGRHSCIAHWKGP